MIPRYDKIEISNLWTEDSKFSTYLEVELAILKALEGTKVPAGISNEIQQKAEINPSRINEIEKITKHDIIAFCTSITEQLPVSTGKYFHFGVTSSDIIDTSVNLQIKRSLEQILPVFKETVEALLKRAEEMKDHVCLGRSHGMYAEPMSFGGKLLGHYAEFARRFDELNDFYNNELTAQFSGAVGNYAVLTPEIEELAASNLKMHVEPCSTQVIPRDRIAKLICLNALTAAAIERLSVEIRHLHRSDVGELHEGFAPGQKGSSTMPHKKNPISAENLTGMARILKGHVSVALENIVLWHERDISHSSTERLYLPDNLGILYYSLSRLKSTILNLNFHSDIMEEKVSSTFVYLSSYYLHFLIEKSDLPREELYKIVQEASFAAQSSNNAELFSDNINKKLKEKNINIKLVTPDLSEIKNIYLKNTDAIFSRVKKQFQS
ncbi:MAG: adenylosuccinate lyase [Bdellovibrionales bacterium]|jgi:adenylosuccinate lyase|nr:adenylosuccinate lyase [Bdellovibrionales bacterium]